MARPVDPPREGERIAKLLARAGVASRREIERMIAEGRIARGGIVIDTPATVLASLDSVTVDGNPVAAPAPARLFLYHKPPGLLVTERDPQGRPTIYDRLPKDLPRVVPVGRLDRNTEGLLLLTTDGGLKRQLELPATGVERTYRARAYGPVGQEQLEALIEGIEIDGFRYGPIDANMERRTGANSWIELTLAEGKNREVRRVLEHLGLEVSRLIRTRYGPFVLGDLPAGAVGEVRQADLAAFRQTLGKATPLTRRPANAPRQEIAVNAGGSTTRAARLAGAVRAASKRHPDEGQVAGATFSRSGATASTWARPTAKQPHSASVSASPSGPGRRSGQRASVKPTKPVSPAEPATPTDTSTRPAKLQRKPGWAKPKPKPGARPPKKR